MVQVMRPRQRPVVGLLLMLCLSACVADNKPVPLELRSAPFAQLRDVELGMSSDDLQRYHTLRPAGTDRYIENVAGYDVYYDFEDGRLNAVSVPEVGVAEAGMVRFFTYQEQSQRSLGVEPVCRFVTASGGMIAQFALERTVYEISHLPTSQSRSSVIRSLRREPSAEWTNGGAQVCKRAGPA
jgi:hypothetical protein